MFSRHPADYLPHRFPFLLLDNVTNVNPGVSATAEKLVTSPEGFPTILLIECIAQLAGIAASHQEDEGGFLATIDHAEFHNNVSSGDLLKISANVVKSFGRLCLIEGCVECVGKKLAEARMTLGIGKL